MQTDTPMGNEALAVQTIKEPVTNNPRLVQVLGNAGFVVTNNDVIIRKKDILILRKRINGENPDGSPKYYDVPMQLASNVFKEAVTMIPTEDPEKTHVEHSVAPTETIPPTPEPVAATPPVASPMETQTTEDESEIFLESAMINGSEVLVGQVLETAPHIAILDFVQKESDIHAILINMKTGETARVRISDLASVSSLADIESLFSH